MDLGRMHLIEKHSLRWRGPISAAILIQESQWEAIHVFVTQMSPETKNNVRLNIAVAKEGWKHYPINKMRNLALTGVETKWVYILDTDENTIFDMSTYLTEVRRAEYKIGQNAIQKSVLAVTSWQWKYDTPGKFPVSKKSLQDLFQQGYVDCKAPHFYRAYKPPSINLENWFGVGDLQRTKYGDSYEPYFIALTGSFPLFDERFVGFGGDKSFLEMTMAARRYGFYILPNVFTFVPDTRNMAMTHAPPADPEFMRATWRKFGEQYGCSECEPSHCIKSCPWIDKSDENTGQGQMKIQSIPLRLLNNPLAMVPKTFKELTPSGKIPVSELKFKTKQK